MGALFERPAFLLLFLIVIAVAVIVAVVLLASRGGSKAPAPAAPVAPVPTAVGGRGWYPQPDGSQRYWDGQAWTEHTA